MKSLNSDKARHVRVRAVVAPPALTVALVVCIALALTPFGTSQVMALDTVTTAETTAPTATSTDSPTATTTPTPAETTSAPQTATPSPTSIPSMSAVAAPGNHHVIARIEGTEHQANYLPVDEPALDAKPHQRFRVRFRLRNAGSAASTPTPRLEYRAEGATGFLVVPALHESSVPMHAAREWVPSLDLAGGTMLGPIGEDIAVAAFRIGAESGLALTGHHSMGANPDQPITLPPDSYTEQEFTIELTSDAQYLTGYELRLTDVGTPVAGSDVAVIRLGEPPALLSSPGGLQGIAVADPVPTGSAYPLIAGSLSAATVATDNIHGPYSMTTDKCAICHRSHTGRAPNGLTVSSPQSNLCFTCHNGTGASTNVQATYTDPAVPQNVVSDRKIYRHDTLVTTSHTSASVDELGGVGNRHSECSDCHNSHKANGADSVATTTGFTNSGRLAGISGVSVVNGAAGTAPAYTFLPGGASPVTREYQICFKCHSGFTQLDSNAGFQPSRYRLDKAVEFNPANPSYHPVEAPGKNPSPKMAASLAGPSPYKQWNFTTSSVISCANCHSNYQRFNLVTPPSANASSPLHASNTAGILRQPYRNRLLKPAGEAYKDSDFALCFMCHSNTPFSRDGGGTDRTNFSLHGYHTAALAGQGNPLNLIDNPGAGGGNAICAECHFRQHSTTFKDTSVVPQIINGTRLVSFAPDVQASSTGARKWTSTGIGQGSCTLTCHGHDHRGTSESYP